MAEILKFPGWVEGKEYLQAADVDDKDDRVVVRLRTSVWGDQNKGISLKMEIRFLKRECRGYNFLADDIDQVGADEVLSRIINLGECDDGVYSVITVNQTRDYESGYINDWDYKLVEFVS